MREVAGDESHPSAQELFERLRRMLPTMSFATVYNTLSALSAAGLGGQLSLAPGSTRFDPNTHPHDHVVCDACGAVRDVAPPPSERASPDEGTSNVVSIAIVDVLPALFKPSSPNISPALTVGVSP